MYKFKLDSYGVTRTNTIVLKVVKEDEEPIYIRIFSKALVKPLVLLLNGRAELTDGNVMVQHISGRDCVSIDDYTVRYKWFPVDAVVWENQLELKNFLQYRGSVFSSDNGLIREQAEYSIDFENGKLLLLLKQDVRNGITSVDFEFVS